MFTIIRKYMWKLPSVKMLYYAFALQLFSIISAKTASAGLLGGKALGSCPSTQERMATLTDNCNMCKVFGTIFNTLSDLSKTTYDAVAPGTVNLIAAGLAIWLAIHAMKTLGSLTPVDPMEFWKTTLTQLFVCSFAAMSLQGGLDVYAYIMGPIIEGGFDFAIVAATASSSVDFNCTVEGTASSNGAFSQDMYGSMECMMKAIQHGLAWAMSIGLTLICISMDKAAAAIIPIPDVSMLLQGAVIYLICLVLLIAAPFYLLDALVRFGVVGCMLPLFIAAWVFKSTRDFSTKGFNMLLQSVMTFISVAIIIALDVQMIGSVFGDDMASIEDLINNGSVDEVKEAFDFGGGRFVLLLGVGYFAFKLLGKATEIANHYAGTQLTGDTGAKLGGMAVNAGKSVAKAAGKVVGGAAKKIGGAAVKAGARGVVSNMENKRAEKASNLDSLDDKQKGDLAKNGRVDVGNGKVMSKDGSLFDKNDKNLDNKIDKSNNRADRREARQANNPDKFLINNKFLREATGWDMTQQDVYNKIGYEKKDS